MSPVFPQKPGQFSWQKGTVVLLLGGVCPPPPHRQGSPPAPLASGAPYRSPARDRGQGRDPDPTPASAPTPPPGVLLATAPEHPTAGPSQVQTGTGADSPWPQGGPAGIFPHPVLPNAEAGGGGSALLVELMPKKARGTWRPVGPSRAQGGVGGTQQPRFFTPASDRRGLALGSLSRDGRC